MTKRDYVAIASVILEELRSGGDKTTLGNIVEGLCDVFHEDNPKFSREVFSRASGFDKQSAPLSRGSTSRGATSRGATGRGANTQPPSLGRSIGSI